MEALVKIVDYDPEWPILFEKEKAKILKAVGTKVVAVEHVGSTSVPGLGAKPIVDILVGIPHLSGARDCIEPLQTIGYEYVPEYEATLPQRRYFRKGPSNIPNKHYHLHMVEHNGEFWKHHLLFRDYLRTHADAASDYWKLKKKLAAKHRSNREAYTEAKTSFIKSVLSKALHNK